MIFTQFNSDDIVAGRINQVSSGMFGTGSLTIAQSTFVTSSTQANSLTGSSPYDVKNGQYYLDVYSSDTQYFSIAYGDYYNSGSSKFDWTGNTTQVLTNETKVIYTQYKNILLQPGDTFFSFASSSVDTSVDSSAIFVVNYVADKFQDQIDPGQIQLNFSGANGQYSFIDDSQVVNKQQNVYNLISGSVINGVPTPYTKGDTVTAYYEGIGLFYPANGVVVLNALKLDSKVGITNIGGGSVQITSTRSSNENSTSFEGYWRNWIRSFYLSIKKSDKNMAVRKSEFVPSSNYFIRVKNKEYNYSNNPTFVSDGTDGQTKGTIIYQDLISNPRTYITTIGLYDSNNELLAVGKLSKPAQKSFDNELLIKARIDF
jgi:hypothetical protein